MITPTLDLADDTEVFDITFYFGPAITVTLESMEWATVKRMAEQTPLDMGEPTERSRSSDAWAVRLMHMTEDARVRSALNLSYEGVTRTTLRLTPEGELVTI